jgi:pyruvate formate lyase activating enzyme
MARLGLGAAFAPLVWRLMHGNAHAAGGPRPAQYWEPASGGRVRCLLCPREEKLAPGEFGQCHVRQNVRGKLITHGYDQPCILNIDPIEKNPLAHFHPGAQVLSIAHAGCNVGCLYCQNWQFSQTGPTRTKNIRGFRQADAVKKAQQKKLSGLVFTYTEPVMTAEFLHDICALAKPQGLFLALCTAGYVRPEVFKKVLAPFDAVTITYKGATEKFYNQVVRASLKPVLDSMLLAKAEKKWLEVATLVVPTHNDDAAGLKQIAQWIVKNLGGDTPWHLERFVPQYKLRDLPPTPQATMEMARKIGLEAGLKYVYISNLAPHEGNHTYCPKCRKAVIKRLGFKILANDLVSGTCPNCHTKLTGIWS